MRRYHILISLFLITFAAVATCRGYPVTWTGPTGLFEIVTAEGLEGRDYSFSFYFNNFDREIAEGDYSIDYTYLSLPLAYGITDRFEASFAPEYLMIRQDEVEDTDGFGDILVNLKTTLLRENKAPGIGLLLFGKVPTADEEEGLGTGEPDYGIKALLSKSVGSAGLHANFGFIKKGDPDYVDFDDQFMYGLGLNLPLESDLQFIVELLGETAFRDDYEEPLDFTVGARYTMSNGLTLGGGVRYNLLMDYDHCPVGGVFHIGYAKPEPTPEPVPTPVPNRPPRVTCRIESAEVIQGQYTRVTAEAYDPDMDMLTYEWSVDGGRIEGEGARVRYQTDDTEPGGFTISLTVSDPQGLTDTCSLEVQVIKKAPERKKVRLPMSPIPFKKGSRVDNVAKALLDDIAVTIKKHPGVNVAIVGHTDSTGSEEINRKVGKKRAENVKKYLADRHNINPDRLTVLSAGESQPVADNDTAEGRAKNRRVEIVMEVWQEVE